MQACFDHNAPPPLDEGLLAQMLPYLKQEYSNASSRHDFGTRAHRAAYTAHKVENFLQALGPTVSRLRRMTAIAVWRVQE